MTIKRTKAGHPAARAKRRLRPAAPKVVRARSSDTGDITSKQMLIGYARVSTVDQNLALQRGALTEAGCTKIFTEQMSARSRIGPHCNRTLTFCEAEIKNELRGLSCVLPPFFGFTDPSRKHDVLE